MAQARLHALTKSGFVDRVSVSLDDGAPVVYNAALNEWRHANSGAYADHSRLKFTAGSDGNAALMGFYFDDIHYEVQSPCTTDCYVDATTGDDANVGTVASPFKTIQKAVSTAAAGGTIHVAAGTYVEDITVNKSLTILGPNDTVNPNTGTRVAEAVLQPATSNPDPYGSTTTTIMYVKVGNVTLKGLTFDGNNPALTSGKLVNGVDVDACEALVSNEGVGNITVANNIFKNTAYSAVDFDNYVNTAATSNNYIQYNKFDNLGHIPYGYGIGVIIYDNFYADVTDNVMTNVRVGVQTGNFYRANPGTTGSISRNSIQSTRKGIFHNLHYGDASALTIKDNVLSVADEAATAYSRWDGIALFSLGGAVDAIVENNTITATDVTQETVGYNAWNDTTTAEIAITGGTVTGGDYGVWVNNFDGYPMSTGSNGGSTAIKVDGVTILTSKIAGVYVKDNPSNTSGATVYANIQNSTIDTDATGILVEGADATAKVNGSKLGGNPTKALNNTNTGATVDAKNNWWGSPCNPSSQVSGNVDFTPWWGDAAGSIILTSIPTSINPGDSADTQGLVLNCAAPGTKITYPTSTTAYPGGVVVTANNITIDLGGQTVGHGTPAYTIVGDDDTLQNGVLDGTGNTDGTAAVEVEAGADNFALLNVEVKNWKDGVKVAGAVKSLKVVNNYFHNLTESGVQVDGAVEGVATVEGNLFKVTGPEAIKSVAQPLQPPEWASKLPAQWNSFATKTCPTFTNVDTGNCTFAEVYLDSDPTTAGDQRHANADPNGACVAAVRRGSPRRHRQRLRRDLQGRLRHGETDVQQRYFPGSLHGQVLGAARLACRPDRLQL